MYTRSLGGDVVSNTSPTNCTGAFGGLIIAGATPYVTADIGSTNEVLDSVGGGSGGVVADNVYGVTFKR